MKRIFLAAVLALSVALLMACVGRFEEVSLADFRTEWDRSLQDSAASWWYAGHDADYHHLEFRRPLATKGLKGRASDLEIAHLQDLAFTRDKARWVNLTAGQLRFRETP